MGAVPLRVCRVLLRLGPPDGGVWRARMQVEVVLAPARANALSTRIVCCAMYGSPRCGYGPFMGIIEAAAWGLAGGLSAGLIALSADWVSSSVLAPLIVADSGPSS